FPPYRPAVPVTGQQRSFPRSPTQPPRRLNQPRGGRVVLTDRSGSLERGQERRGHLLAELHAPLIEGIDPPDNALDEGLVLVEGHDHAEGLRIETTVEERVRGPAAGGGAVDGQTIDLGGWCA